MYFQVCVLTLNNQILQIYFLQDEPGLSGLLTRIFCRCNQVHHLLLVVPFSPFSFPSIMDFYKELDPQCVQSMIILAVNHMSTKSSRLDLSLHPKSSLNSFTDSELLNQGTAAHYQAMGILSGNVHAYRCCFGHPKSMLAMKKKSVVLLHFSLLGYIVQLHFSLSQSDFLVSKKQHIVSCKCYWERKYRQHKQSV